MHQIEIKRAYEPADKRDGFRILVDRVWPRGMSKGELKIDVWVKEIAPSTELRQWFGHDPQRWTEFKKRYKHELAQSGASTTIKDLMASARGERTITLVYSAKDTEHNQAVVLRELFTAASRRRAR
jgi:uncharacterized protein YeaO (DUF488 family)